MASIFFIVKKKGGWIWSGITDNHFFMYRCHLKGSL